MFVPGKPSQPSLMFLVKARSYPRVEHLKSASLGQASAVPANIMLGWRDLTVTNTLAHYKNLLITAIKNLIRVAPGANVIKKLLK